jgi:hypothetical protein
MSKPCPKNTVNTYLTSDLDRKVKYCRYEYLPHVERNHVVTFSRGRVSSDAKLPLTLSTKHSGEELTYPAPSLKAPYLTLPIICSLKHTSASCSEAT